MYVYVHIKHHILSNAILKHIEARDVHFREIEVALSRTSFFLRLPELASFESAQDTRDPPDKLSERYLNY